MADKPKSSGQSDKFEDKGTWNSIGDAFQTFKHLSTIKHDDIFAGLMPDQFMKCSTDGKENQKEAVNDKNIAIFSEGGRGKYLQKLAEQPDWEKNDAILHNELKELTGLDYYKSEQFLCSSAFSSDEVGTQKTGILSEEKSETMCSFGESDLMKDLNKSHVRRLPVSEQKITRKNQRIRNSILLSIQNQNQSKLHEGAETETKDKSELKKIA